MLDPRKLAEAEQLYEINAAIQDGLGCCLVSVSKYEEALDHFGKAIEGDPKNGEYLKNRAMCHFEMNAYDSCNHDLSTAMSVNAPDPQVLYK